MYPVAPARYWHATCTGSVLGMSSRLPLLAIVLVTALAPAASPEQPVFTDFRQRVGQFLKLHEGAPRLRMTADKQEIVNRRETLAQKIRAERANAKTGDIFTPAIASEFRRIIGAAFHGIQAPNVRNTVRQGEPLQGWQLRVNGNYPEHIPETTIPPTLLRDLPPLPSEVEYRIVGHDFVLLDTRAMLIVDFVAGAVP